jgi:hypothetical protein
VAKFTAKETNTNVYLNEEIRHERATIRAFVAKFAAKETNTNLNLNEAIRHE